MGGDVPRSADASKRGRSSSHRWWAKELEKGALAKRNEQGESLEEENRRLRKENERLKVEKAILKKAAAFFARESE